MAEIDPAAVNEYFNNVQPSIMGPYMMDGFGFPNTAGEYRFKEELKIVDRLLAERDHVHDLSTNPQTKTVALDLGSGVGFWAEAFAERFSQVEAVEGSASLFEELQARCTSLDNVRAHYANVLDFQPESPFDLAFSGGLLMYLNDQDVTSLLQKLKTQASPSGVVLCRESTVRGESVTKQGEYSVIYRSLEHYQQLFEDSGFVVRTIQPNAPYILMQTGCELIKKWKQRIPERAQMLPLIGRATYLSLRLTNPWVTKIPRALKVDFPVLENHFFLLEPSR